MRDYAQRVPDLDPLGNPVGFWAIFGVLIVIVILLALGPFVYLLSLVRAARNRPDREQIALANKFDAVAEKQRRLDEDLKRMRDRKPPPSAD
jgi:hypothetical protein